MGSGHNGPARFQEGGPNMHISSEQIRACIKNDQKAQSELYKACFGFLMPVCRRYASNDEDARELLNLGFYKMLRNLKKYRNHVPFIAWSKRVLINTIIDEHRKLKRYRNHVQLTEETDDTSKPRADEIFEGDQAISADDIYRCIQNLPPMTATVFNLYAMDGYLHKEIAKMLRIKEGTSKWHYSEARRRLRDQLASKVRHGAKEKIRR